VRQAARLVEPDGALTLVAVAELEVAVQAGWAATTVAEELRDEAEKALERARAEIAAVRDAETLLLEGPVTTALLEAVRSRDATLLCTGTSGHGRASGIVLASTSTTLLHEAPCAVLVARTPQEGASFPSAIVVGVDGSEHSDSTVAAGAELRDRFGASLRTIAASRGQTVDLDVIRGRFPGVEIVDAKPLEALVEASKGADLLVVGSRGLHGLKALGSVSERAAHQAKCSVLVVRGR
jgi:nucleotide-binding universal stress UspA family protein